jgi:hypothetical protein
MLAITAFALAACQSGILIQPVPQGEKDANRDIQGAWRVTETASRSPGGEWNVRATSQGGLYVFSAQHYSYFYVRGAEPRARFADANRPTDAEKAATFDTFIAGARWYERNEV